MAPATAMEHQKRKSAVRSLLGSASALMVAMGIERGCGFFANLLAARLGGAGVYGAYSLALSTANNIASYAGAGIGLTATRFSGEYPEGTAGHRALRQALILVSAVSSLLAIVLLYLGAEPLARVLLHNASLTGLLRIAAFSSGAMIAFECCRGYLIGQRKLRDLVLLSAVMGIGVLVALPLLARGGAKPMVMAQMGISLLAVAVAAVAGSHLLGRRQTPSNVAIATDEVSVTGMAGRVWRFGGVQLAGVVGLNAAGWWVASLIARSDISLVQMGLFAVASQLRNLVALAPGLLAQSSYAMLASKEQETADHVLGFSTAVATTASLVLGAGVILPLPFLLPLIYGRAYTEGVLAATIAVATAIVHMSSAPASARLNIVSLRVTGLINTLWAVLVAGLAYSIVTPYGASGAAVLYFGAHLLSTILVAVALRKNGSLPDGVASVLTIGSVSSIALVLLAWTRHYTQQFQWIFAFAMVGVASIALVQLVFISRKHHWLPDSVHAIFFRRRFA